MELTKEQLGLASDAWEALMRAHNAMRRVLQEDASFSDVSVREYDILYSLARAGRPLTQRELLDAATLSQPALSRMLTRLEERGLVERDACPSDGRSTLLSLTEEGKNTQRVVGRKHGQEVGDYMWSALSKSEMEELVSLGRKLQVERKS